MKTTGIRFERTGDIVSPLLFGHFIEFIENCIQGGVYDPGSPSSDENGIRLDVLEKAKALRPTLLRWPGGTYTHIYHWMDSVGPIEERRKRRNLIWGGVNDGAFGTAEFILYCRKLGAEPMLAVNMASGTAQEAADWVEYCNGEPGSYYADLRVKHGYPEPFNVKYWCIGNECAAVPDLGPQHVPERYISDAWEFTKHMKLTDPSIKLVFVGDAGKPEWNRRMLKEFEPVCDYFSLHHYSGEGGMGTYGPFMSLKAFDDMLETFIPEMHDISANARPFDRWYRFPGRADDIKIIIDEWNIWNSAPAGEDNRYGLKMRYNWRDALWTACAMNLMTRRCRDIGAANLAQLVNVIAPIMTCGDTSYVQTTYHPLKLYRDMLEGEMVGVTAADMPFIDDAKCGKLPMLDMCAAKGADGSVRLFAVNLSETETVTLTLPEGCAAVSSGVLSAAGFDSVNAPDRECVTKSVQNCADCLTLAPGTINAITLSSEGI